MAGVEAAGLLLAAFPLVISGVQAYRAGLKPLRTWRRYRTKLQDFHKALCLQQTLFENNIERLLDSELITLEEMGLLLRDPGGPEWSKPRFALCLQQRLGRSYESYMSTIEIMKKTLETLKGKLELGEEMDPLIQSTWQKFGWKAQLRRIQFSFSKDEWEDLVRQLDQGNSALHKLLVDSNRLVSRRSRRNVEMPSSWNRVHDSALSLSDIMSTSWHCSCTSSHCVDLLLDIPKTTADIYNDSQSLDRQTISRFDLLFSYASINDTTIQTFPWHSNRVDVRTIPAISTLPKGSEMSSSAHSTRCSFNAKLQSSSMGPRQSLADTTLVQAVEITYALRPYANGELQTIECLCATLSSAPPKPCSLGALTSGKGYRHEFYSNPRHTSRRCLLLTDLLSDHYKIHHPTCQTKIKLSRRDRKTLSLQLAIALLQLYSTPWIPTQWNKNDIVFQFIDNAMSCPEITKSQAFLRLQFPPLKRNPNPSENVHEPLDTRAILFNLGVMLLELCVGRTLEDYCCHSNCDRIEDVDLLVYRWWEQDAMEEDGLEVAEVIRKCICFDFQTCYISLHEDELRAAFFTEVVKPLEEAWRKFNGC